MVRGFLFVTMLSFLIPLSSAAAKPELYSSTFLSAHASAVSLEIGALTQSKSRVTKIIRAKQIGRKKRSRARELVGKADTTLKKLSRLRRKFGSVAADVSGRELLGKRPTKKQLKRGRRSIRDWGNFYSKSEQLRLNLNDFAANNPVVPTAQFRGSWNTNFGRIVFTQDSNNVVGGTYFYNGGGVVSGKVKGNVLSGSYRGEDSGTFSVTMNSSNTAWSGSYRNNAGTVSGGWSARR